MIWPHLVVLFQYDLNCFYHFVFICSLIVVTVITVAVTSVDFNPVDDNYFINGSTDGKVRIWEVLDCRIVDYNDIREIVTAACYRPGGGKGGLVGKMSGNCLFDDITDNRLQSGCSHMLTGKNEATRQEDNWLRVLPKRPKQTSRHFC